MMVKAQGAKYRWITEPGKSELEAQARPVEFVCELRVEVNGRAQVFVGRSPYTAADALHSAQAVLGEFIVKNA